MLWAESKRGVISDLYKPLVQLILTIGKARTFETYLPPPFLAAFDVEKIAFIPYKDILPFFALNDFNWTITPSDDSSREFGLLFGVVRDTLVRTSYIFRYDEHEAELREFIKQHIKIPKHHLPRATNHRERKDSFFTPKIWVDLSQKYLADVLGENWQDEYYVWDCAAGTGNLLNGLTNKYNIWASTLDQQDVDVMKDRIKNGANLLESHVFQFDFLNDEFTKLPQPLQDIINNPEKRKKLVIYINPPYVEADNRRGEGRNGVEISRVHERYDAMMGYAKREVYIQFIARIYAEISTVVLALFSKLKIEQTPRFVDFRNRFQAKLESAFLVPANTFDNVKGEFPIAFQIWNTSHKEIFKTILADVYNDLGALVAQKIICSYDDEALINEWANQFCESTANPIGTLVTVGSDFQNQRLVRIENPDHAYNEQKQWHITSENLIKSAIYLCMRIVVAANWLNDREQFLQPNVDWEKDAFFQTNCLTYSIFSNKNSIQHLQVNHWIPFTEQEVNAKEKFASHFMTDFIAGRCPQSQKTKDERRNTQSGKEGQTEKASASLRNLSEEESFVPTEPLVFSAEATAVFDAGRELWRYYHAQPNANPNASYYDIREHFHGRNEKGKMNPKSDDAEYMRLLSNLKEAMEVLRQQIVPKVYEYGFLI